MRFTLSVATLFAALLAVSAQDTSLDEVRNAFNKANIPRDLNINFNPNVLLEVTFPQRGGRDITVHAGEQLARGQTVGPPTFAVRDGGVAANDRFVIAAVDPDAPTPQHPTDAQIRNFLGGDFVPTHVIPVGTDPLRNLTAPVSRWLQPHPPAGSPPHRYVFLLFRQPGNFDKQNVVTPRTPRDHFSISNFARETNLGNPIGGTFILVGPDGSA